MESVISYNLKNIDLNVLKTYAYFLKKSELGSINKKSSVNGFQSFEFYEINESVKDLFDVISNIVNTDCKKMFGLDLKLGYYWLNINGRGSYNETHHHMGTSPNTEKQSIISGVFYIQVPNGDCGNIIFTNKQLDNSIKPKNADLLLFPASMIHRVDVNNTYSDRISIAFNYIRDDKFQIKNIF